LKQVNGENCSSREWKGAERGWSSEAHGGKCLTKSYARWERGPTACYERAVQIHGTE